MQKLMRTTALIGVLAGLVLAPALGLAGEDLVAEPIFTPEFVIELESSDEDQAADTAATAKYDDTEPTALTDAVVADFEASIDFCGAIAAEEYVIDCLSERLEVIAAALPDTGEFAEMRATIAQASRELSAVAAQNPSATLPSGIVRSAAAAPVVTTRPLRPVATETLTASLQAADAIVARAAVVLLRSSSNSQDRSLDYQRVAAVVGTTRSLLRSA